MDVVKEDMLRVGVTEKDERDRVRWRQMKRSSPKKNKTLFIVQLYHK